MTLSAGAAGIDSEGEVVEAEVMEGAEAVEADVGEEPDIHHIWTEVAMMITTVVVGASWKEDMAMLRAGKRTRLEVANRIYIIRMVQ